MSDPIANAGQQEQKPEGIAGEIIGAVHALEEKVENFIHPSDGDNARPAPTADTSVQPAAVEADTRAAAPPPETPATETPPDAGNVAAAPAATMTQSADSATAAISPAPIDPAAPETAAGQSPAPSESPSGSSPESQSSPDTATGADGGNQGVANLAAQTLAVDGSAETEVPNDVTGAAGQLATPPSAQAASMPAGTQSTGANSFDEAPLHTRIAPHLEAIYQMALDSAKSPLQTASAAATNAKAHIGDILHRLANGVSVADGEIVQKLEKLFQLL